MGYTSEFKDLKEVFNEGNTESTLIDNGIQIFNVNFTSTLPSGDFISQHDRMISENHSFSYPVFTPADTKSDRVILLFHGLNERSWIKYLPWAKNLASMTGSYVVLFPISFHINRSPSTWKDPRAMRDLLNNRNSESGQSDMSSFANVALSNRLTEDPMRFFKSGYQTVEDIIRLTSDISTGNHPVIPRTSKIDIFAYSIGAFMSQIIMLGNPDNIFTDSRLFIFCGGSVFSNMKGASKFIMDKLAFDKVYDFYMQEFEGKIAGKSALSDFLHTSPVGMAFRSMIDLARFRSFREARLKKLRDQISAIGLLKDKIIPVDGIRETLTGHTGRCRYKELDFPFSYSHENPFPVVETPLSKVVDHWFETIFREAALFLA